MSDVVARARSSSAMPLVAGVAIGLGSAVAAFIALLFGPTPWWPPLGQAADLVLAGAVPLVLGLSSGLSAAAAGEGGDWAPARRRIRLAALLLVAAIALGGLAFALWLCPGLVLLWFAARSRRRC